MKDLISRLFPTWFAWAGLIFTTAGFVYSIANNLPWVAAIALLPILFALAESVIRERSANKRLEVQFAESNTLRAEAERKLQQISADKLLRLESLLLRGSFEECFDSIYIVSAYISRLQKLTKTEFSIREVFAASDSLYVAAKALPEALTQLNEDDAFVMFAKRSGLNHPVAKIRLHQVNEKQETIFLQVVNEIDRTVMDSLRALAHGAGVKGLKDYGITPEIDIKPFEGQDMDGVTRALDILRDEVNKAKQTNS